MVNFFDESRFFAMSLKIGDLVSFQTEHFFDGAVQLRWVQERERQAHLAARAFVFHGPRYHGAGTAEHEGVEGGYRLKDSASFVSDLLVSINGGLNGEEVNPYWLVVAGYGAGKSHLALTCATLLGDPLGETSQKIIANISNADAEIGKKVESEVSRLVRPVLVLSLDGMSGFHLGNALSQAVFSQLRRYGVDSGAIRALSPRFQLAEQFVVRNFAYRQDRFAQLIPGLSAEEICTKLRDNDEQAYADVDILYAEANGSPIPVVGQESAQELINTLCDVYCGDQGVFSSVLILFDEFGRYLEYAADKPQLAGDAALQQVFQGVQDNSSKVRFVGLIQYELKAYLKRFGSADLRQLQRYITRFDSAQKWYLSTNLETIFAHMIGKRQDQLKDVWEQTHSAAVCDRSWQKMRGSLPGFERHPVWNDNEKFARVIAEGCWPLHPLATWFLTRQRDVVQSRSALTFIKEMIERISHEPSIVDGVLRQVSAAELVLSSMLPELISAERETGSTVAETLQLLLEKFQSHLNVDQRLVLAGVAILEKMRVGKHSQESIDQLLSEATCLGVDSQQSALQTLSQELGAIEWNRDLGQYELIADASTRGQFQQWLRKNESKFSSDSIRELFVRRGPVDSGLGNIQTDFAAVNNISTQEWYFEAQFSHSNSIEQAVTRAFDEWSNAITPTEAKGKIIYFYVHSEDEITQIEGKVLDRLNVELSRLKCNNAPIWIVAIVDSEGKIAEQISRICVFDEQISIEDRDRFQRFVPVERARNINALHESIQDAVRARTFWIAGFSKIPQGRLKKIAEETFSLVYPDVVPFPFDGFGTAAGGGALDCAQLTRSLIARQVDGAWVQAQSKRLQNRVASSLVSSWKTLPSTGVLTAPAAPRVKIIYETLKSAHSADPGRTLWTSYKSLIAPPFGMNAASAGLLLGLFLGDGNPPRRLEKKGVMVASGDWVNDAYPVQKGRHFLDQTILEISTLKFLSEDSEGRWRSLLKLWEDEKNYKRIFEIGQEVEQMQRIEPRPEKFDGLYLHLKERSDKAMFEILDFKRKFEDWEFSVERTASRSDVGEFLRLGTLLKNTIEKLGADDCWPEEYIHDAEKLLNTVCGFLSPVLKNWISLQGCSTATQVADFRQRMKRAADSIKLLGFDADARILESQAQHSIAHIEARQKFSLTLDQSDDFPRQPDPTNSTTVREMRDAISEGESLIAGLEVAESVLKKTEIDARVNAIRNRQKRLKEGIEKQTIALSRLFDVPPETENTLRDLIFEAKRLKEIFAGTRDQSEVSEILFQLERIQSDIEIWEGDDLGVERLEQLLEQRIHAQFIELGSLLEEKDIDAAWDLEKIYSALMNERVVKAKKRSEAWFSVRCLDEDRVSKLNVAACVTLENELVSAPNFLSDAESEKVRNLLNSVSNRRTELEESDRRERVTSWQMKFLNLSDIQSLSKHETEQLLRSMHNPPYELLSHEYASLQRVEIILNTHLDQMSIEELVERISRLSEEAQRKLVQLISERQFSTLA
jgi:hypothetical protein